MIYFGEIQSKMEITALAGGVGGAKLVEGLSRVVSPDSLTVVVNTGDDFIHMGLKICPDLDTICYSLAGLSNPATGWGRNDESWNALEIIGKLGGPTWFRLGDKDLGLHLERARLLNEGFSLSQITALFCKANGIGVNVLPMSDDDIQTIVITDHGGISFQEYFVRQHCEPEIIGFKFAGIREADPAPGVIDALETAELVVLCPSNPWVSLDPILSVSGVRQVVENHKTVIMVSPIIGGNAVKGPAAKMFSELGFKPSATAVAEHYVDLLAGFVFDSKDIELDTEIQNLGIKTKITNTIMQSKEDKNRLALEVIEFAKEVHS